MRLLPVAVRSAAVLVLAAACTAGGGEPSPSAPAPSAPAGGTGDPATAEDLEGRAFVVTGADGYTVTAGSEITLTFQDGRLGISAGCNQMGGDYVVADGVLTVGPMMTTEMACEPPLMAQDQFVSGFVSGAEATLAGDVLALARDGVTLTLTDRTVAHPALPLEGTTWTIDGLVAGDAVSSMPLGVTATLVFANGRLDVNAGCNRGSGSADVGDTSIRFGPIATTKMACDGPAGRVEAHVLGVLQGDVAYRIDGDSLTLAGAGGGLTARGS